ncbi:MAG: hypothetical protein QXX41_02720 [Nitrososphaerota archaeon]
MIYRSYKTCRKRLKSWQEIDLWNKIFRILASKRRRGRICVNGTMEAKEGRGVGLRWIQT